MGSAPCVSSPNFPLFLNLQWPSSSSSWSPSPVLNVLSSPHSSPPSTSTPEWGEGSQTGKEQEGGLGQQEFKTHNKKRDQERKKQQSKSKKLLGQIQQEAEEKKIRFLEKKKKVLCIFFFFKILW